jgi:hypothetical protein
MRKANLHSMELVLLTRSKFWALGMTWRKASETSVSGSQRAYHWCDFPIDLLMPNREELCEQVFDEILDTIVMKVQRQIDESRRIATHYDHEPDLQIEVRYCPRGSRTLPLTFEIGQGRHSRRRSVTEPLPQE